MKKIAGLILIFAVLMPIITINAAPRNLMTYDPVMEPVIIDFKEDDNKFSIESGVLTEYFKGSDGYDKIINPEGETLVSSQRWTVEYLDGPKWKQIGIPYEVTAAQINGTVEITRHYTNYLNTEIQVISRTSPGTGAKTDVVIDSGEDRVYRLKWNFDGINNDLVSYGENFVNFTGPDDWITVDWNDAFNQYGDISSFEVSESTNGKKLEVIFNVGLVKQGERLVLDPTLLDSYLFGGGNVALKANHPSAGANSASGQTFFINETDVGFNLSTVEVRLKKTLNPTGNAVVAIYNVNGTPGAGATPLGAALATSDVFDVTTLGAGYAFIEFNFSGVNQIGLQNGTWYFLVFQAPGAGLIDNANFISMDVDDTAPTHPGNGVTWALGVWITAIWDAQFRVFGVLPQPQIKLLESTNPFNRNLSGWVNVTVQDDDGVADLNTVTIQVNTTGDAENFTLRWTQAGDTFTEVSDLDNIVILNAGSVRENINVTHDKIAFNFTMTGGTDGFCDVLVTAIDDAALTTVRLFPDDFLFILFGWTDVGFLINSAGEFWGINDIMGNLQTLITGLAGDFSVGITNFLGMIRQQLRLVYQIIGWFITSFTGMVTTVLNVWNALYAILDDTSIVATGLGNWWTFIALDEWIDGLYLGILILWIESISTRGRTQGEITVFLADVNQLINLTSFFVSISLSVFTLVLNNVLTLFDAIMTVIPV